MQAQEDHVASGTNVPDSTGSEKQQQLYFAYGSNLSPTQMRSRYRYDPTVSGTPLAIARLDGWRWTVNERHYANVVRCRDPADDNATHDTEKYESVVYGVVYSMTKPDESWLDVCEGVDFDASRAGHDSPVDHKTKPKEQGNGAYNKWYLPVTVTTWINGTTQGISDGSGKLTVLVYVDEKRVGNDSPHPEYVERMKRGIQESTALGLPEDWVKQVIRQRIPGLPN